MEIRRNKNSLFLFTHPFAHKQEQPVFVARMPVFTVLWRRNVCGSEPIIAKLTSAYARLAHLARQKYMFLHMSRLAYLFTENGPILRTLKMQFGAMPTDKLQICIGIICKFI